MEGMKEHFRQSMAWLHTWTGLLLGWLLYFMFVTGTVGYLDTEIDRWMQPEAPMARLDLPAESVTAQARAHLEAHAPDAERWFIGLPIDRNTPYPRVLWSGAAGEAVAARGNLQLDPQTGAPLMGRDTAGGQTLYRMHWTLHYLPRGVSDWLVGVATMFMLVALVSGVIIHRKIFADFFTFRPGKGQRSWLDAHNVTSVVTLPFQLMITYSGLIFMMFIYMPLIVAAWYGPGDQNRQVFFDEVFDPPALVEASGKPSPLLAFDRIIAQTRQVWGVRHPGDANARIVVRGDLAAGPLRAVDVLVFDGVSGALLAEQSALRSGSKAFRDVMLGLHEGLFAGPVVRALYALSGLLGSAMIATGLVLWAVKRRQRIERTRAAPHFGLRLVERLNVASIIGLPVAIAAYFWANRLLAADMADRAAWEVHSLFLVWLALFAHAALRPAARAWVEQGWLAAAVFGLLPVLNALTTDRHLVASVATGDWVLAGFDLVMLALGVAFAAFAWRVGARTGRSGRAEAVHRKGAPARVAE
jgi:uncharacterized iron-regulated membrane protein